MSTQPASVLTFGAPPQPTAEIAGRSERFPIHRVYCVGRNYAAHIREMGLDPDREPPFFFMKPADSVVPSDTAVPYPPQTADFHHEIELVIAIGAGGSDIPVEAALDHVFGYGVGMDLTRRDLQVDARNRGRPWESGKSFDHSAPLAPLHLAAEVGPLSRGRIWLTVNGDIRQEGDIGQMIWSTAEVVSAASRLWELRPGDLIYSGTPEGVGALAPGDLVEGGIDGLTGLTIRIGRAG